MVTILWEVLFPSSSTKIQSLVISDADFGLIGEED
jgi:hypothetical protein